MKLCRAKARVKRDCTKTLPMKDGDMSWRGVQVPEEELNHAS
jgi:hypothetical protein